MKSRTNWAVVVLLVVLVGMAVLVSADSRRNHQGSAKAAKAPASAVNSKIKAVGSANVPKTKATAIPSQATINVHEPVTAVSIITPSGKKVTFGHQIESKVERDVSVDSEIANIISTVKGIYTVSLKGPAGKRVGVYFEWTGPNGNYEELRNLKVIFNKHGRGWVKVVLNATPDKSGKTYRLTVSGGKEAK